ncbi:hypothetical protein [Lactiplantibacillus mudanjiangensis]|uniref:Uncharacterized protein n=1 Tax=Lactiplantibacillus mudanjiangensis TaxID=1296538 RepID=A0A660E4H8_9LACO|nr:hypothetical protein [Lactiplantibacillus mudanjiangensis]VDG23697.1 hypothetical protein [Lactobacillus plantarum] [Lactiplantibacillus mudanjiangensis]VDG27841.1 hypothetical protein [Lactobacillus plantarum] [Lactiplantibacillus mudanjiangensis]
MTETGLTKFNNVFMPMVANQLEGHSIQMTDYQKTCVMSASQHMYELINKNGIDPNNIMNDISNILMTVASLQLNANAQPAEIYFQTRNIKVGNGWSKTVEMGIEGDGNDAILARFGRNVKHVYPVLIVREGDTYVPSKRKGIHVTDPEWEPGDDPDAKVTNVVYSIEFWTDDNQTDSTVEYYATNRELVKPNLLAHMINNLRSESRKNPKSYAAKIEAIKTFAKDHTVDEILDSEEMQDKGKISPAWKEPQSREQMIVRKMRNNIVKKIPKDFSNGLVVQSYEATTNESLKQARRDVTESANQIDFDEAVEQPEAAPESEAPVIEKAKETTDGEIFETPDSATTDNNQAATSETVSEPASQAAKEVPF